VTAPVGLLEIVLTLAAMAAAVAGLSGLFSLRAALRRLEARAAAPPTPDEELQQACEVVRAAEWVLGHPDSDDAWLELKDQVHAYRQLAGRQGVS
jgi:hypothetical protein